MNDDGFVTGNVRQPIPEVTQSNVLRTGNVPADPFILIANIQQGDRLMPE